MVEKVKMRKELKNKSFSDKKTGIHLIKLTTALTSYRQILALKIRYLKVNSTKPRLALALYKLRNGISSYLNKISVEH